MLHLCLTTLVVSFSHPSRSYKQGNLRGQRETNSPDIWLEEHQRGWKGLCEYSEEGGCGTGRNSSPDPTQALRKHVLLFSPKASVIVVMEAFWGIVQQKAQV